jgi:hypothetical protein
MADKYGRLMLQTEQKLKEDKKFTQINYLLKYKSISVKAPSLFLLLTCLILAN